MKGNQDATLLANGLCALWGKKPDLGAEDFPGFDAADWELKVLGGLGREAEELQGLREEASAYGAKAHAADMRAKTASFREWVDEVAKKAPGALHSVARGGPKNPTHEAKNRADPFAMMRAKREVWSSIWKEGATDHQGLTRAMQVALEEDGAESFLPPFDDSDLERSVRGMSLHAGRGSDALGPGDLRLLPPGARRELGNLFLRMETAGQWAWQLLVVLVVLLGKPSGDDRAISLLAVLARVWGRLRRGPIREWSASRAGFWDAAVAGSSALRQALGRALKIEC